MLYLPKDPHVVISIEMKVLEAIARGLSRKEIQKKFGLSGAPCERVIRKVRDVGNSHYPYGQALTYVLHYVDNTRRKELRDEHYAVHMKRCMHLGESRHIVRELTSDGRRFNMSLGEMAADMNTSREALGKRLKSAAKILGIMPDQQMPTRLMVVSAFMHLIAPDGRIVSYGSKRS